MVVVDLLRDVIGRTGFQPTPRELSTGMIAVLGDEAARFALLEAAAGAIDDYMSQTSDDSVFKEPAYATLNFDLNRFLKWEKLGKSDTETPRLRGALAVVKHVMGRGGVGQPSPRQIMQNVLAAPASV